MNKKYKFLLGFLVLTSYIGMAKQDTKTNKIQLKPIDYIGEIDCISSEGEKDAIYYILETQPNIKINFSANKNISEGFNNRKVSFEGKNNEINKENNLDINKRLSNKRNLRYNSSGKLEINGNVGINNNENVRDSSEFSDELTHKGKNERKFTNRKSYENNFSKFINKSISTKLSIKQKDTYIFPNFPLSLGRFYEILRQKYIFIPNKQGYCGLESNLYVKSEKPIEALAIIRFLSTLYHFQYFLDGNIIYKPTYVVLNRTFRNVSELIKFLAQQIQLNNPELVVEYNYKNKYFAIYSSIKKEKALEKKKIEKKEKKLLAKVENLKTKVFYLKGIKANDFVKLLGLKFKNVIYTVDPIFNAVTLIASPEILKNIEEKYSIYLKNSHESGNLISKVFYLKYGDINFLLKNIGKYLSPKGLVRKLPTAQAIEIIDYPQNIAKIERIFGKFLSQKPVKIKITVKFVEIDKNFAKTIGINWALGYGQPKNYQDFNLLGGISDTILSLNEANTNSPILVTPPQPNYNYPSLYLNVAAVSEKLNPINVAITAGEDIGLAKELSSPSIVLLNGEAGEVSKGIEVPYQSVDENGNIKIEYKKATLGLSVKPVLLSDGRILLAIKLSKDSINQAITVNGQPAINTFTVTQNIVIPNGGSIVIGGILEKEKENTQAGVPGLMNIPLLGWLFKTQNWKNNKRELYIVVTAKLVND